MANLEEILQQLKALTLGGGGGSGTAGSYYNGGVTETFASGATMTLRSDINGNTKVVEQYAPGYEDNTAGVAKVEHRYTPFTLSTSATITIVRSVSSLIHTVNIGMLSNPTLTIYDNPSGASGTILAHIEPQTTGFNGNYLVDAQALTGITAYMPAGNATRIIVNVRT